MGPIKNTVATKMIFLLSKLGAHQRASAWVDRILDGKVSLNQLRKAVHTAKMGGQHSLVDKYVSEAIRRYPENSFGYIERAASLIADGRIAEAQELLEKAPNSRGTQDALAKIKAPNSIQQSRKSLPNSGLKQKKTPKPKASRIVKENVLENDLLQAGTDVDVLLAIEQKAKYEIATQPNVESNYTIILKILEKLRRHPEIIEFISTIPATFSRKLNYCLSLSKSYQRVGQHCKAYEILINSQIEYPADRRLLMRLSDLLRDDAQPLRAYSYMRAARACYPEYGAVRQLSFEIDHKLYSEAEETFIHVLRYPTINLLKFLPMFNRATPFFMQHRLEVQSARLKVRQLLDAEKGRKGINPSDQLRIAVKARWIEEAKRIAQRAEKGTQPVTAERSEWLQTVISNIGDNRLLFDVASINEDSDELYGVYRGAPILLSESGCTLPNTIEIFIPTVFFADPQEEKASYATVREFLSTIFNYLQSKSELILVPRHQWNWRYCDPRLDGARVISYHTNNKFNSNHLHIQELSLAGRCSLDNEGFAGYSSLSHDFEKIRNRAESRPTLALIEDLDELASLYISNNISKYGQTEAREEFTGEYVFVALQIPTDTVASLAYIDGISLVTAVANFYKNTTTQVIVKRHPYCNSKSVERCLNHLRETAGIIVSSASVHDLISNAKTVFTVNSGVGLEALLHKKPVVVTGECDYAYAVSSQSKSPAELQDILSQPQTFDITRTSEFFYYYINIYSAAANDINSIQNRLENWLAG